MANNIERFEWYKTTRILETHSKSWSYQKQPIPMTINKSSGQSSDVDTVLNTWKNDFHMPYNNPNGVRYDKTFYDKVSEQKSVLENYLYSRYEIPNDPLNTSLTVDELENVLAKLTTKKPMGWDNISNEVIKI